MYLWAMVRGLFLWLPWPLFALVWGVFLCFFAVLSVKILKAVWDAIPFL